MLNMMETRIGKDIKIRIQIEKGYYSGYIYNNGYELKETDEYIMLNIELGPGWNKVVDDAITRIGCKRAILNWLKRHTINEYNITVGGK